eukprot:SAG31_NODE_489_length_14938_cov_5.644113_1_plen_533_part_00
MPVSIAELRSEMTAQEWRFVLNQRWSDVLVGFAFAIHNAGWIAGYIRLAGSAEAMAVHYGICSTVMAVLNFVGEPIVAALSDTFGRKPFLMWGRLGLCSWFLTYSRVDQYGKLWMRLVGEAVCFGVVGVGHWSVFAASHSDVFGTRADLSSRIQSSTQMWTMMARFVGEIAGVSITNQLGAINAGHISCACGLSTFAMLWRYSDLACVDSLSVHVGLECLTSTCFHRQPETLAPSKRKPFRLSHSNPVANLKLLLASGPGLRKLSLATIVYFMCNNVGAVHGAFQLGALRWTVDGQSCRSMQFISLLSLVGPASRTPHSASDFDAGTQIVQAAAQAFLVLPFLASRGSKSSFEIGAMVASVAYAIQACAPAGFLVPANRTSLQNGIYGSAFWLQKSYPEGCQTAMRAMVVRQGIATTSAGRGELNAAYGGYTKYHFCFKTVLRPVIDQEFTLPIVRRLGKLTGMFMPLVWASIYRWFATTDVATQAKWLRWGAGGHLFIVAGGMLLARVLVRSAHASELFLDDHSTTSVKAS